MELLLVASILSFIFVVSAVALISISKEDSKDANKTTITVSNINNVTINNNRITNNNNDETIVRLIDEAVIEAIEDKSLSLDEAIEVRAQLKNIMINNDEYSDYSVCELKDVIEIMIHHIVANITRD